MATANVQKQEKQEKTEAQPARGQIERAEGQRGGLQRGGYETRSPFAMMRRMFDDMDRLFGDFGFGGLGRFDEGGLWSPQLEVSEKDGKLVVHADLPGLRPEDIKVNVEDDMMTISGERRNESENREGGIYRSERSYGRFERRIALPRGVDPNAIEAKFDNGVLELTAPLPKQEPRGRNIEIKGGTGTRELGSRDTQKH